MRFVSCGHTEGPHLCVQDYKSPPHPTTPGLAPDSGRVEGVAMLCDQLMRLESELAGKISTSFFKVERQISLLCSVQNVTFVLCSSKWHF